MTVALLFSLSGFDRIYADPPATGEASLRIANPYGARVVVSVGGVAIGELLPKAVGNVPSLEAGAHDVTFELPNGYVRRREMTAE